MRLRLKKRFSYRKKNFTAGVFCDFCEIFLNSFFKEDPWPPTSIASMSFVSIIKFFFVFRDALNFPNFVRRMNWVAF